MKVEETQLFSLYFHELFWLASGIRKNCEAIFGEAQPPEQGHYIKVSPELHAKIHSVLIASANIKKLIRTAKKKFPGESQTEYQFRQQRSKLLSTTLEGVNLSEIIKSEVRNTLEHFDEYLDRANIYLSKKGVPPSPMAAYNMALSDWNVFSPPVYPVRVYIAKDKTFHNLQHSINVGTIYEEAQAILKRLRELRVLPQEEEPGALMIRLREV